MKDENSGRGFWDNFQVAGFAKFPKLAEAITNIVEAMSHLGKGAKAIDVFKVAMSGLGNVLKAHPIMTAAAAIGAIVAIGNLQGQAFQNKISANNQTIADSEAIHESSLSLYELYTAYQQASEAADGTAASTQTVASASAALADALGIEKDAIDDLTESYKDKTTAQLKSALIDAELRRNAAANNLTLYADAGNTKSRNEDSFGEYMPDSIGWYMNEYGIDYSKEMSDFDKAEAVVDLYESLSVRQREIAEELRGTGKTSTPELKSIQQWINILKPYVESYQKAQDGYNELVSLINNVNDDKVTQAQQSRSYVQTVRDSQAAQIAGLEKQSLAYSRYIDAIARYNSIGNEALENLIKVAEEAGYSEENLGDFLANFDTYAEKTSSVDTEIERMQQGLKLLDAYLAGSHALNVWDSLKSLLDSEEFSDTKAELKELAETVDGITPDKVLELAQNNKELASVLNTTGMTAQFLANILQNEALQDGSGLEMITDSALMLNYALNSTASAFASVVAAKSQYDAAMSAGEVDDNFKSFAQAYETLQGEIDAGKQGNTFWASAEYVFGAKQLEEWGYSVEKVASAMAGANGILGDAESGGFGFLDKLYSLAEGGKVTADDGSVLAEIEKLSDGSYDFNVNMDQLDSLAEKVGVSKEAILASMEALSLWGDVSYYDIENVMGVMKEIGLASDNFNGTAVNVSNLTEQLMQLGYKGKALHDIKEAISSLDGVTLIDINGDIGELANNLVSLGIASQDGSEIKINADSFAQMAQSLQFSKDQATSLFNQLKNLENVSFVDNEGIPVNEITFDEQTISMVVDVDDEAVQAFMNQNHDKTATLTYNVVKSGDIDVGGGIVRGAIGGFLGVNAHARGTDSAPGGPSMVGEDGEEIVQSGDKAYFVGTNGPEIVNLNKGDTVYTADETKKIKNGRHTLSGHIPSFKFGTSIISNVSNLIGGAISGLVGKIGGIVKKPANNPKKSPGGGGGTPSNKEEEEKLEKVDWIERAIKKIEREIDKLKKTATSTFKSLGSKMTAASNEIAKITEEIELQGKAAERYRQEAESVELDEGLKQKVRDGTIDIQDYNEETRKLIDDYKKWIDKSYECEDALTDLHDALATVYEDNFNAIKSDFDNQLGFIEHDAKAIEHNIDMLEAKGYMSSTRYYEQMQQNNRKTLDTLNAEMAALEQSLADAVSSGEIEEGSEAWYSMKNAVNETQEKIDDTNLSMQEIANTIRQIQWDYFDFGSQKISALADEAEFLTNLMSGSELFDKQGKVSDTGLASMGLHGERYNVFMADADRYAEEIKKLDEEIANDPHNTTLLERRQELIDAQRESILTANDEKTAIRDLVKQGIDLELQAMQDLIDKYSESLDAAKDLYDYQKKVKSQADDIKNIQKQLAAYENDLSEEARAKVQKLTVSLQDAQDKLNETEYQQYIADQKKLLNNLYSDYEQVLNERLDDLDALVSDVIAQVNKSSADICDTLEAEAGKVGYSIEDATKNIWNGSSIALDGALTTYGNDFSAKLTGVNASLSNILNAVVAMAEHSNAITEGSIPRYKKGGLANYTGLAYMDGTSTDPEIVLDARDSANLIALRDLMRRNPDFSRYTGGGMPAIDAGSDIMRLMGVLSQMSESGATFGDTNIYIDIDHVENYNDFVNKLREDPNFDKMIRAMTTDRLMGGSPMAKTKYRW